MQIQNKMFDKKTETTELNVVECSMHNMHCQLNIK